MRVAGVAEEPTAEPPARAPAPIAGYAWSIPGLVVVALMLLWAVHDGGYDADTWYWGALLVLGLLAAVVTARGWRAIQLSRSATVALVAFALYVAWSYLSISWAAVARGCAHRQQPRAPVPAGVRDDAGAAVDGSRSG